VQTCALPISRGAPRRPGAPHPSRAGSHRAGAARAAAPGAAPPERQRDHSPPRTEWVALVAKPAVRLQVVEVGIFVGLALLAARAAQVQIGQGRRWAEEAQAKRTERIVLAARRGAPLDRHGM